MFVISVFGKDLHSETGREGKLSWRKLGDIRLVRGDAQRPLDYRRTREEGEWHLGDTSLAGLPVMPGSDDRREREGHVLD